MNYVQPHLLPIPSEKNHSSYDTSYVGEVGPTSLKPPQAALCSRVRVHVLEI